MKSREEVKRDLVRQWSEKAEEDLGVAEYLLATERPFLNAVCFHAQQAAEKYLKAYLVYRQLEFPKTHDLGELLDLIAGVDVDLSATLSDAADLNPYSVNMRYPADLPDLAEQDAERAIELAVKVRNTLRPELLSCFKKKDPD